MGYSLFQIDRDKKLRPVYHSGRSLRETENNYPILILEGVAIACGLIQYEPYLSTGYQFIIRTDATSLSPLLMSGDSLKNTKLNAILSTLLNKNYRVEFISSEADFIADHTSRLDKIYLDELEMLTKKYNAKQFKKQQKLIQRVEQFYTLDVKVDLIDNTLKNWLKIMNNIDLEMDNIDKVSLPNKKKLIW